MVHRTSLLFRLRSTTPEKPGQAAADYPGIGTLGPRRLAVVRITVGIDFKTLSAMERRSAESDPSSCILKDRPFSGFEGTPSISEDIQGASNRLGSGLNILDLQVLECILEHLVNVVAVLIFFLFDAPLIFIFLFFILKIELGTRER